MAFLFDKSEGKSAKDPDGHSDQKGKDHAQYRYRKRPVPWRHLRFQVLVQSRLLRQVTVPGINLGRSLTFGGF